MYAAAPRVERRFLEAAGKLDDRSEPMAETYRRTRDLAQRMGVPRPSYERLRMHLTSARRREAERPRVRDLVLELAYNTRSADAVVADLVELLD